MNTNIQLYKELLEFCENNLNEIETKFQRHHTFEPINEDCFEKIRALQRKEPLLHESQKPIKKRSGHSIRPVV